MSENSVPVYDPPRREQLHQLRLEVTSETDSLRAPIGLFVPVRHVAGLEALERQVESGSASGNP